jgi:hypothetical protein
MKLQLITGEFETKDALDLIKQMIEIKIKFHEGKIKEDSNEEDIKSREKKIKRLQDELYELRSGIDASQKVLHLESVIEIN